MAPEMNDTQIDGFYDYDYGITHDESDLRFHVSLYKVVVPMLCCLITLIGIVGNTMVIIVICCRKNVRNTVNMSLLNLAVCDLLFVTICVPFVAYHYAADNWLLGEVVCKLFNYLLHVTVYVTVYILMLVSILRYLTIVHGTVTAKYRTQRNIALCLMFLWAAILIANTPVILVYRMKSFPSNTRQKYFYCGIASKEVGKQLFLSFFVLTYFVPLATIATLYIAILWYLRQERKHMKHVDSPHAETAPRCHIKEHTLRATRIIITVVVVFGACWLPLHVHLLIVYFGVQPTSDAYEVFRAVAHFLAYSNSCLNPIIYNYSSNDFRKEFNRLCRFPSRRAHVGVLERPVVERVELMTRQQAHITVL